MHPTAALALSRPAPARFIAICDADRGGSSTAPCLSYRSCDIDTLGNLSSDRDGVVRLPPGRDGRLADRESSRSPVLHDAYGVPHD